MLKLDIILYLMTRFIKCKKCYRLSRDTRLIFDTYLTKLAFRSQSLELIVLADRMDPFVICSILLLSGK